MVDLTNALNAAYADPLFQIGAAMQQNTPFGTAGGIMPSLARGMESARQIQMEQDAAAQQKELFGMKKQAFQAQQRSALEQLGREQRKKELLGRAINGDNEALAAFSAEFPEEYLALQAKQAELDKLQAETGKTRADAEKAAAGLDPISIKTATDLRKTYTASSADYIKVRDAYNRVEQSAKNPSPAGDIALIFNYMKMLDPGSVVREGEFATAANAGSIPENIRGKYNKALTGERLTDTIRKDFVNQASGLYGTENKQHEKLVSEYKRISKRMGVPEDMVIIDYKAENKEAEDNDPLGIR